MKTTQPFALGIAMGALAALPALAPACTTSAPPPKLTIDVAPLDLPGIGIACYDLAVTGAHDTVWSLGDTDVTHLGYAQTAPARFSLDPAELDPDATTVCSGRFGNGAGGAIAYVGPCDASADADTNPTLAGVQNNVTLWVDGLYTADGTAEVGEWQDPCPDGCTIQVNCSENRDARAQFDLTVLRDANQGFFDVAVDFGDVFCSAKLDTCYDDGKHIELLQGGGGDDRDWSAVLGFACTAGPGQPTQLHYGDIGVDCEYGDIDENTGSRPSVHFAIDPKLPAGNQSATATSDGGTTYTLHYGIYRGNEDLQCNGQSCDKRYWNIAFDLADLAGIGDCRITADATADVGEIFENGTMKDVGPGVSYPFVEVDASLTTDGAIACVHHHLDETEEIKTIYEHYHPDPVCNTYDGTAVTNDCKCPCWDDVVLPDYFPVSLAHTIVGRGDGTYTFLKTHSDDGGSTDMIEFRASDGEIMMVGVGYSNIHNGCSAYHGTPLGYSANGQSNTRGDALYEACYADFAAIAPLTVSGCGDGVIDPSHGEQCEDGNVDYADGCNVCRSEYYHHYSDIAAGGAGNCAIRPDTSLECWSTCDQLGDFGSEIVKQMPAGTGFIKAAVGGDFACALRGVGAVSCWGLDTSVVDATPTSGTFDELTAGYSFACARAASDHHLVCWGAFPDGDPADLTPTGTDFASVSGDAEHACALDAEGHAVCWGGGGPGTYYQQGVVPAADATVVFSAISAGANKTCAIVAATGAIECWGRPDWYTDPDNIPTPNSGWSQVGGGNGGGCGLQGDTVRCWDGEAYADIPTGSMTTMSLGPDHGCALDVDGFAHCWSNGCGGGHLPVDFTPDD